MEPVATSEALGLIAIPVAAFSCLWIATGIILWLKPGLWDITKDASQSPHLVEEDMVVSEDSKPSSLHGLI
jgi:hypothetical protein